ncbi:MAG: CDP-diacylglycerol--serine O-phosphatidyltransferase [Gammaproteobacteria bacterium]|jgi:CDP-diacylglycerol--serine O-phosphatidyltransferase|nr:CDP-diacylglycerol--serine O-phosphatidyltransferase [Gammaproteobacteria bacterium]NBT43633.1 CDP-diacylglycerol--serine O-phosphatidyltransferase [Gammaproteobacteria bacterium]NBY23621.1 CDP-diacylglycerol--serine O-phosphatidyltransferase [Gammaproteobacteria bacterium]
MQQDTPKKHRRRGIYLLPNLLTTAALFSGFYAITSAMNGSFEMAAELIFIAMILDGLDGRVARLTNTQSAFGAEYDSMADMVSFGVAPGLVIYAWALASLGKAGWVAVFVHAAGAALRLARFNTQLAVQDKRYFQGLPSPAAAAVLAGFVWVSVKYEWPLESIRYAALGLTVSTGLLMVSNFRYYSFKDIDLHGRVSFLWAILVMLIFAFLFTNPPLVLFTLFTVYALSGLVLTLGRRRRIRTERRA